MMSALAVPAASAPREMNSTRLLTALRRPLQILLAEDNATNQLVFAKLMQAFDVEISIAANGRWRSSRLRQALSISCSWTCACPKWTGWRQRARSARSTGTGAVPIIALTANAFADDVKDCRDAGMNAFIAKPMRKKILIETLASCSADHPLLVQAARAGVTPVSSRLRAPAGDAAGRGGDGRRRAVA